jgi:methyl-accepting chemotaxis protein
VEPPLIVSSAFYERLLAFLHNLTAEAEIDMRLRFEADANANGEERAVAAAVNRLLDALHADVSELGRLSNAVSAEAASNSFLISRIADAAADQSERTAEMAAAIEETARGAEAVSGNTRRAHELAAELRERSERSIAATERTLASLADLESGARDAVAAVGKVADFSRTIGALVDVIDDISAAANLLGINAAIEAAHAGEHGRGFGVVASEIKKLADSTRASTQQIAKTIAQVQRTIDQALAAANASLTSAAEVGRGAAAAQADLGSMSTIISDSTDQVAAIASTVEQQSETLHNVSETVRAISDRARSGATDAAHAKKLRLADLNRETFAVIGRYRLGSFFDAIRAEALRCAEEIEAALEALIAAGTLSEAALFDRTYTAVTGARMRTFDHLFSSARAGPAGYAPPKFTTAWDTPTDTALAAIVDRRESFAGLDYVCIVDFNGFLTMHARKYRRDITGDPAADLRDNRVKRIFEDEVGLRCGRVGLAGAESIPKRATVEQFRSAGIDLRRRDESRPFVLQTYARDTGVVLNDFSCALYVRGRHWGGVRFAYDPKNV